MDKSGSPAGASDHRSALIAGYLGGTLDKVDFFPVIMALTAVTEFLPAAAATAVGRKRKGTAFGA